MDNADIIDLKRLYFILKRRFILIAGITSVFLAFAVFYTLTTPAQYTAQTVLLLDKSATNTISNVSSLNLSTFEPAAIESDVEIIRSKRITDAVATLLADKSYIRNVTEKTHGDTLLYNHLRQNLNVSRVGQTYTLSIKYTSMNPEKSAEIANAFAQAYIDDQLNALSETSEKTLAWLQDKSAEVNVKLSDARARLQERKTLYNKQARRTLKANEEKISLEEITNLEKEVTTYETIYESYLEKIRVIGLEQSFPVTETRIITYATPPLYKSHPKEKVIIALALIAGIGLGSILALIIDLFDNTLRRAGQVQRSIGVPFLGFYPDFKKAKKTPVNFTDIQGHNVMVGLNLDAVNGTSPLCTETSLIIKNAIDRFFLEDDAKQTRPENMVIGVVSAFAQEGTTFVANSIALTCANSAEKTILIDSGLYDPSALNIKTVQQKNHNFKMSPEMALSCSDYPLDYINKNLGNAHEDLQNLNHEEIASILSQLRKEYTYTVVDLPPLHAASKFSAYTPEIDLYIVIGEWGKSLPNSINFYLDLNKVASEKICGMVLTKTNMKRMKNHYGHYSYATQSSNIAASKKAAKAPEATEKKKPKIKVPQGHKAAEQTTATA